MLTAAYSPILYLVDSHVASYKIYILKNPINDEIFYVGQTVQDLQVRLSGHISCAGSNREKTNYIKKILEAGEKPIIQEVESIHTTCYIDKVSIYEREAYWIKHYKGIGCKLLNMANPQAHEYKSYLASIKRGEASWHYYYCGRTISGIEVYDEKRLLADGFELPTTRKLYDEETSDRNYNPWKNERFIKKIGYRNQYDNYSYVPCYNDTNQDYYDEDY